MKPAHFRNSRFFILALFLALPAAATDIMGFLRSSSRSADRLAAAMVNAEQRVITNDTAVFTLYKKDYERLREQVPLFSNEIDSSVTAKPMVATMSIEPDSSGCARLVLYFIDQKGNRLPQFRTLPPGAAVALAKPLPAKFEAGGDKPLFVFGKRRALPRRNDIASAAVDRQSTASSEDPEGHGSNDSPAEEGPEEENIVQRTFSHRLEPAFANAAPPVISGSPFSPPQQTPPAATPPFNTQALSDAGRIAFAPRPDPRDTSPPVVNNPFQSLNSKQSNPDGKATPKPLWR